MKALLATTLALASSVLPTAPASAYVIVSEPDKKVSSVGRWTISTARWGVGCVASMNYEGDDIISIGGEKFEELTLLITVDPRRFRTKLDGSEENADHIEIALADDRSGDVRPYGYRGTPGVVLAIETPFLESFVRSKKIKVTEMGWEKLSIDLERPEQVIAELRACFHKQ
jgi:hypothetical protein